MPVIRQKNEKLLQDFSVHVSVALGRLLHLKFKSKAKKHASDLSDGDEDEGGDSSLSRSRHHEPMQRNPSYCAVQ